MASPAVHPPIQEDPKKFRCGCGKYHTVNDVSKILSSTGVMGYFDVNILCPECRKNEVGMAKLVCTSCKTVVGLMKPHKDQHGFRFETGKHYHVDECGVCKAKRHRAKEISKAESEKPGFIVEKILFMRKLRGANYKP